MSKSVCSVLVPVFIFATMSSCIGQRPLVVQGIVSPSPTESKNIMPQSKTDEIAAAEAVVHEYFKLAVAEKSLTSLLALDEEETKATDSSDPKHERAGSADLRQSMAIFMTKENAHFIAANRLTPGELKSVKLDEPLKDRYDVTVELLGKKGNFVEYETFTLQKYPDGGFMIVSIRIGH